jgi:hypothetical protein
MNPVLTGPGKTGTDEVPYPHSKATCGNIQGAFFRAPSRSGGEYPIGKEFNEGK